MATVAQQMASTAKSAQEALQDQARLEAEKKAADQKKWFKQGVAEANKEFPAILEEIKALSQRGLRKHDISIQSMSTTYSLSPYKSGYDEQIKKLLTENGFEYTTYSFDQEPVGSDPISWDTLYYYGLNVSW
jgi:hypothetical protein